VLEDTAKVALDLFREFVLPDTHHGKVRQKQQLVSLVVWAQVDNFAM
jgi:hypothetical protein